MSNKIPEGWALTLLQAITEHSLGGDWGKGPDDHEPDAIRVGVVRGTEFKSWSSNKASTAATRFVSPSSFAKRRLRNGDLVVEVSGGGPQQPVGRVLRIDQGALGSFPDALTCSNFCRQVRICDALDSAFVELGLKYHYATGKLDQIQTSTTNLRNLDFNAFLSLNLPIAPLPEQHRIVEKVEALFEEMNLAKARLDRVPLILKKFRQSVLAVACSGELTREWRKEHNDQVAPSSGPLSRRFEVDEGIPVGELPASWTIAPFGHLTEFQQGMQIAKRTRFSAPGLGRLPILRTVNYATGFSQDVEFVDVTPETLIAEADDVLLSRTGTIGRVLTGHKGVFHNNSFRLNYDRGRLLRGYLVVYLESSIVQGFVQQVSGRSAQPDLTHKAFGRCPCPLPPMDEQIEIVRQVEPLLRLASGIEGRVRAAALRAEKMPQAILSKAFSGELVPTEAELARIEDRSYETAEELLRRVTAPVALAASNDKARRSARTRKTA